MLHPMIVLATALRVFRQLRRDPRTVAMLVLVPTVLLALMRWVYAGDERVFQRIGVPLIGIFPLTSMFLVTSITMLRERTTGTLERLMTMPLARGDLLAGYALAFTGVALVQVSIAAVVAFGPLGLETQGRYVDVVLLAVLNALLGMSLGLFVSAFARTEFQAVQFMPALLLPQFVLSGLLAPRDRMEPALEWVSNVLPMSYAYDGLLGVARGESLAGVATELMVVGGFSIAALALGAMTLSRRTA